MAEPRAPKFTALNCRLNYVHSFRSRFCVRIKRNETWKSKKCVFKTIISISNLYMHEQGIKNRNCEVLAHVSLGFSLQISIYF